MILTTLARTAELNRVLWSCAQLVVDSQTVVAMRVMGLTGARAVPEDEHDRMLSEKAPAFTQAMLAGALTAWAGRGPDRVLSAVIEPISTEARANRARLANFGRRPHARRPSDLQTTKYGVRTP